MSSIAIALAVLFALPACKKSTTADCAQAIGKGIDQLSERRKQRIALRKGDLSPAAKAEADAQTKVMEGFYAQLKPTLTKRCAEDKWPAEVIDCYEGANSAEDMRNCRTKLPADAADRARVDEVNLMTISGSAARVERPEERPQVSPEAPAAGSGIAVPEATPHK